MHIIIKAILQDEWFNIMILIWIEIYSKAILIYKTDMSNWIKIKIHMFKNKSQMIQMIHFSSFEIMPLWHVNIVGI